VSAKNGARASSPSLVATLQPPVQGGEASGGGPRLHCDPRAAQQIETIGSQLDRGIFPRVFDGGFVAPSVSAVPSSMGVELSHVRSEASHRPGPWTPGARSSGTRTSREGTAWTSRETSSVECTDVRSLYQNELAKIHAAYPGTCVWSSEDGIWLLTESSVVAGLKQAAVFLTAVNCSRAAVRSWGFWRTSPISVCWIGPRHTNFPDGSVCAFDRDDLTWVYGEPLVDLLDLYTVWALRHLHLNLFRRWPGPQSVPQPYERLSELGADELCGCDSGKRYGTCCLPLDVGRQVLPDAVSFTLRCLGGVREPPARLAQVALYVAEPPPLSSLTW
jgi:hypothetical protein